MMNEITPDCRWIIEAVDALEAISTVMDTFPGAPWLKTLPVDGLASDAARRLRDLKDELRRRAVAIDAWATAFYLSP